MIDNSRCTGAAVEAHYQFLTWLITTIEKFPRSHKFTIADRVQNIALDVLEALIEATYRAHDHSRACSGRRMGSDRRRWLFRLFLELGEAERKCA